MKRLVLFSLIGSLSLLGAYSHAADPATTQPVTAQIEDDIKTARDDYQRAISHAIDRLEKEKQKALDEGDRDRVGKIADLIVKLKGPLVQSGRASNQDLDAMFNSVQVPIAIDTTKFVGEWVIAKGIYTLNADGTCTTTMGGAGVGKWKINTDGIITLYWNEWVNKFVQHDGSWSTYSSRDGKTFGKPEPITPP